MSSQNGVYGIQITSNSLLFAMIVLSAFLVIAIIVSMMRIYKKAGKPSISALVPIWSQIVLFQIVGKPAWYFLLTFIPIVGIVVMIQAYILLAKKFGKGTGFGIGMVFLPMIFIPLLSFYDYISEKDDKEESIYNPFNQTNVTQVMPTAPVSELTSVYPEQLVVNNLNVQEPINEVNNVDSVGQNVPAVPEGMVPINEGNVVDNSTVNENVSPEIDIIPEVVPTIDNINMNNVITEMPQVENNNTFNFSEDLNGDVNAIESENINNQVSDILEDNQSPIIHEDINQVVNVSSQNDSVNIAFGQQNIIKEPVSVTENMEHFELTNVDNENSVTLETLNQDPENFEAEDIELPEIAAKTCPACGVSLAEENKFCTSCGTQI